MLEGAKTIGAVEALRKPIDSEWFTVLERVQASALRQTDTLQKEAINFR